MTLALLGSVSSIPASYPTANGLSYRQSQSVPAVSIGSTYQSVATFGASVQLTHTQKTAPVLSSNSEAPDYFDVPNHQVQQKPNSFSTPMDVDANGSSSELNTGKGKKKDNSKQIPSWLQGG
jgi:hypothetical protein